MYICCRCWVRYVWGYLPCYTIFMEKPDFNNPYFDRLVGISSESERQEEELAAINTIEELGGKKIEEFEIEKTPRDIELLKFAEDSVRAVLQKYGRKKEIQVPLNNIHVLVAGGTKKSFDGSIDGAHFSLSGSVVVDRFLSDIKFTTTAFHELMHLLSYKALQLSVGEKKKMKRLFRIVSG